MPPRSATPIHSVLLTLLVFAWVYGAASAQSGRKPNIVIILADDLGFGDVHALNDRSTLPTPNLDRLASEGMSFTDAHSPAAVCTPTRYGLLTGRYCWRSRLTHGVLGGYSRPLLEPGRATIADLLRENGYQTAVVGKWHLGMRLPTRNGVGKLERWDDDPGIDFGGEISDSPIHHGFDRFFGVSASLDMAPYVYIRNDRFTQRPSIEQPGVKFPHFVRKGPRAEDFIIDEVLDRLTEEAVQFVSTSAKAKRPFFLYLALTAPHKPTQPHARFEGKTELGPYGDFVAQVDWSVGRVVAAVDRARVGRETLVVFTSDNGSYMRRLKEPRKDHADDETIQGFRADTHRANGPFRGTKADIWEGGHHVPFLVRWPQRTPAGKTCATTVCLTDLFATCADIVGAKLGRDVAEDSLSLLDNLVGERRPRGAPVIHHSSAGVFAIRDGKWKLVAGTGSGGREHPRGKPFAKPFQLFDLSCDVAETENLADDHPEVVRRLSATLDRIRRTGRSIERSP